MFVEQLINIKRVYSTNTGFIKTFFETHIVILKLPVELIKACMSVEYLIQVVL